MNELTRQIQGIMIPKAALIAYELQNVEHFFRGLLSRKRLWDSRKRW